MVRRRCQASSLSAQRNSQPRIYSIDRMSVILRMKMKNSPDLQQIAVSEVAPDGESVVWFGQPNPVSFALTALPVFIFAIPWTGFALFWMYGAAGFEFPKDFSGDAFSFFPLFGLPFVLVGIAMLSSPLFSYAKAFRTLYIVTNKSVRIVTLGRTKKVETYIANDIGKIERKEKPDGSGDIIFKYDVRFDSNNKRREKPIGFYGVPDVRSIEQHLVQLRRSIIER